MQVHSFPPSFVSRGRLIIVMIYLCGRFFSCSEHSMFPMSHWQSYKESTLIMQLLRDNLTLWTEDMNEGEGDGTKVEDTDDA